ncbi:hypothetical protein ORV05_02095 [Amycolatopsis cynarae]|uniref:Uncharacterized protein n=1 Tax=Amycolatopsis cynarae TaxID=2995223 RepID=A0ABY7B6X9_9PSEU|nr:hypothetical protein [Amycolatopsis sp. HUAS 11-8]WAL66631.1 hypothetical protein ORV05_02095 [Amycolatopsis sp. HUAS 11-8]
MAVVELDAGQGARLFDKIARDEMGISGDEFLRRWDAGEWDDVDYDTIPGLIEVRDSLPFVR